MRKLIILSSILFSTISYAQGMRFNQVNLTNLYSNPALTGINSEKKISSAFRNSQYNAKFDNSAYISYQDGTSKYGNFGVYFLNSNYSDGAFNSSRIGLNYAKPIKLTENLTFTAGVSGSFIFDHINYSKITFGDISNYRTGMIYMPLIKEENTFSSDFSGGILLNWKNIFGGVSFNQFSSFGARSIFNTYSNIGISLSSEKHDFILIPEISLNTIQGFYTSAVKLSSYYKWAKLGFEYSYGDSFSAIAGARIGKFDFAISTRWTSRSELSELTNYLLGLAFEVGLSYTLSERDSKNKKSLYNYSLF